MKEAKQVKKESEREPGKTTRERRGTPIESVDIVSKSVPLAGVTFFLSVQMETFQNWHFVLWDK